MTKAIRLGVVMDPISSIKPYKDTTFAMLLEAQRRGYQLNYMEPQHLFLDQDTPKAEVATLSLRDNNDDWFSLKDNKIIELQDLDVILMRQDPPFDMDYIYVTYLLEKVARTGVLLVNDPASVRDCNEKLYATNFPQCCPPLLVASQQSPLRAFIEEQEDAILKPLDGMGGSGIFRVGKESPNIGVIIETLTLQGTRQIMAQKYLPEIKQGDKRILVINGEAFPYCLARIPSTGETRGNLAAGGTGEARPISDRDKWIVSEVKDDLLRRGLMFVGLDVIGDYLTEINVTSPTCVREIDSAYDVNISAELFNAIENKLK